MRSSRLLPILSILGLPAACSDKAQIGIAPAIVDFGTHDVGGPASRATVAVTTLGEVPLELSEIGLRRSTSDLSLAAVPESRPYKLGETAMLVLEYQPQSSGDHQATLVFRANDGEAQHEVPVLGRAEELSAEIEVAPGASCVGLTGSIDFGLVGGGLWERRDVVVRSTGSGPVEVRAWVEGASNESEWAIDGGMAMVASGESMSFDVVYSPRDIIDDEARLVIATNVAELLRTEIPLCGRGLVAALCNHTPSVRFARQAAGTSTSADIQLESCGNVPLELRSVSMANDAEHSSSQEFSVSTRQTLPSTLSPGETAQASLRFDSSGNQGVQGFVRVESSALVDPVLYIPVGGNTPAPCQLSVEPAELRFYGSVPIEQRVVIANDGSEACSVDSLGVSGARFLLISATAFPVTLQPKQAAAAVLGYRPDPQATGTDVGSFEYAMTAGRITEVARAPLYGNPPVGAGCQLQATPGAVSFGELITGDSADQTVSIANLGVTDCRISDLSMDSSSDGAFAYTGPSGVNRLAPGDSTLLPFLFHPLFEGHSIGTLVVTSDDGEHATRRLRVFGSAKLSTEPPCLSENCRCSDNQTRVYNRYDTPFVGSRIIPGDQETPFHETCGPKVCADGEVSVEHTKGSFRCTTPPPACAMGEGLEFTSTWSCVDCDVVVQFGYIFDGLRVCAPAPPAQCSGGVPTFSDTSHRWECAPRCNGGLYDPVYVGSDFVCIPC